MSDLSTQLRTYFDENVERVTPEDVLAGRHLGDLAPEKNLRWFASPRLAVGLGFAVTVFIVGGSLGLGLALRQPSGAPGSGFGLFGTGAGPAESTGWSIVGIAAVLVAVGLVFAVFALASAKGSRIRKREGRTMSTAIDTPTVDNSHDETRRANRWLIAAVVVLAVAVVVLGAWVINDLTATSESEPPAEVRALVEGFQDAWNSYDGEAIGAYVSEPQFLHVYGTLEYDLSRTRNLVNGGVAYGTKVGVLGDYVFVESGSRSYVVVPGSIKTANAPEGGTGVVIYTVAVRDGEWKIINHEYIGSTTSG